MPGSTTEPKPRRTQEERSATTQAALLDATIECVVELGYAATTTTVVSERAGVSRGAQLHHFPTKASLVSAALERLARKLGAELHAKAQEVEASSDRVAGALNALWSSYSTPLFQAWLELCVAARTDDELRAEITPLEARLREGVSRQIEELFAAGSNGSADHAMLMTVFTLQGMALNRIVSMAAPKQRERVEQWTLDQLHTFIVTMAEKD